MVGPIDVDTLAGLAASVLGPRPTETILWRTETAAEMRAELRWARAELDALWDRWDELQSSLCKDCASKQENQ